MKPSKRVTRPSLERKAPIRAWATLFGAPNGASNGAAPGGPAASRGRTNGAGIAAGAGAAGTAAVQRGVEFAYRVSEEYLRQGQAMAQAFSQPFARSFPAPLSTNGARGGSEGALAQLTERMLRYTAELSSMWMDAARMMPQAGFGAAGFGAGGPGATRWPTEAPRAPAPPAAPPRGLAIQLDSKARARATLDVRGPVGRSVRVEPPKLAGGKARITAVEIESEDRDGPIVVSIKIPAKQAAGTYVGDVLDADTGVPVGRVTIKVSR
jgi:hypothetical protein